MYFNIQFNVQVCLILSQKVSNLENAFKWDQIKLTDFSVTVFSRTRYEVLRFTLCILNFFTL